MDHFKMPVSENRESLREENDRLRAALEYIAKQHGGLPAGHHLANCEADSMANFAKAALRDIYR